MGRLGFGLAAGVCVLLAAAAPRPAIQPTVRLATTTSVEGSGLLGRILPPMEERFGVKVHVIAVGTGRALALAQNGDVDAVLVHAPEAEERFIEEGHGVNRRAVAVNDFLLVGPPGDPAGVAGAAGAADGLARIARAGAAFASRGDESGTHQKEEALWRAAGVRPAGAWYLETGQGMGPTLLVADEKQAYCLTDCATYHVLAETLRLRVLVQGGEELRNPYSVIAVNPARHGRVNYFGAMMLIAWLTSPEGQGLIGQFQAGGEVLFHPAAAPQAGGPSRPAARP